MQKEVFKDIPNYKGYYQVSNLGNVKSLQRSVKNRNGFRTVKERILKPSISSRGYYFVGLTVNGETKTRLIHTLIAESFLNHFTNKHTVCDHIDNDKLNNNISNLQIITIRLNSSKDRKNCSSKYTGVCWNKHVKKWQSSIYINSKSYTLGYFKSEKEASLAYQKRLGQLLTK